MPLSRAVTTDSMVATDTEVEPICRIGALRAQLQDTTYVRIKPLRRVIEESGGVVGLPSLGVMKTLRRRRKALR